VDDSPESVAKRIGPAKAKIRALQVQAQQLTNAGDSVGAQTLLQKVEAAVQVLRKLGVDVPNPRITRDRGDEIGPPGVRRAPPPGAEPDLENDPAYADWIRTSNGQAALLRQMYQPRRGAPAGSQPLYNQ
jgi:hypothetical protein